MAVLGKQNNLASREKNSIVPAILAIHPGISWVKVGTMILKSFQLQLWVLDSRLRQTAPVHLQEKCHIELKTFPETVHVSWERSSDTKALQTASLSLCQLVWSIWSYLETPRIVGGCLWVYLLRYFYSRLRVRTHPTSRWCQSHRLGARTECKGTMEKVNPASMVTISAPWLSSIHCFALPLTL